MATEKNWFKLSPLIMGMKMSKIKCSVCGGKGHYLGYDTYGTFIIENNKSCPECYSTGEIEITDTMRVDFIASNGMAPYKTSSGLWSREAIDAAMIEFYGRR